MIGLAQFGIVIGALGVVLTFMSLFPGAIGMSNPTPGIGIVQFAGILTGFLLLFFGALLYVKHTFYEGRVASLAQQIGVRLALTGLVLSAMVGFADVFGFGSHPRTEASDAFFGPLQMIGMLSGFLMSALGVAMYALTGHPPDEPPKA